MISAFNPSTHDWTTYAFSLVTPDALHRGQLEAILSRYAEAGFHIERGLLVDASCGHIDQLYADHIERQWEIYRFRLVDRLVSLGRSLALVLRHESLRDTEMYEHLNRIKGSSNPYEAASGTIRCDLGAVNAIVGLLHTSDNPTEANHEAAIFLNRDSAGQLDCETVWAFAAVNAATSRFPAPSFDAILGRLRFEICLAVGPLLSDGARAKAMSTAATNIEALAAPAVGAELADALSCPRIGRLDLRRWLAADFWPGAKDIPDVESEADQLRVIGIRMTAWERLVLETSTYFPSISDHSREGVAS